MGIYFTCRRNPNPRIPLVRELAVKPLWYESRGIIPWMILVAIGLGVAVLFKEGIISILWLGKNKDAINAGTGIVTSFAILIGGTLTYLKFFKGRVLRPKVVLAPTSGFIILKDENLHWIDIAIENKGSVAIWNFAVEITAVLHGETRKSINVTDFIKIQTDNVKNDYLIDVGETTSEHAVIMVPKQIQAVTFLIKMTDQHGTIWDSYLTTTNKPQVQDIEN